MPKVTGSIVTEADLNGSFTPRAGITPGSNNTLAMSVSQITARYFVNVTGDNTANRLPSWDQLTSVAPSSIYIVHNSNMSGGLGGKTELWVNGVLQVQLALNGLSITWNFSPGDNFYLRTYETPSVGGWHVQVSFGNNVDGTIISGGALDSVTTLTYTVSTPKSWTFTGSILAG